MESLSPSPRNRLIFFVGIDLVCFFLRRETLYTYLHAYMRSRQNVRPNVQSWNIYTPPNYLLIYQPFKHETSICLYARVKVLTIYIPTTNGQITQNMAMTTTMGWAYCQTEQTSAYSTDNKRYVLQLIPEKSLILHLPIWSSGETGETGELNTHTWIPTYHIKGVEKKNILLSEKRKLRYWFLCVTVCVTMHSKLYVICEPFPRTIFITKTRDVERHSITNQSVAFVFSQVRARLINLSTSARYDSGYIYNERHPVLKGCWSLKRWRIMRSDQNFV